ncbi:MAG TPA: aminotransferase class III-fold pyridoxal phosphate-dependent enzyme [Longimicrobium sp.]|nr:aminotransferase class III-fold pyridoxal phosphate-dependent enzyme [Longimicrobium sp.]
MATRARGSRFWDPDENEWLDLQMALGAVLLGHADPVVNAAVSEQLGRGVLFSVPATLETIVAGELRAIFPEYEAFRFAKNGSDATSAAVRLARAATGREPVITCGYHGWPDWSTAARAEVSGIPQAVRGLSRAHPPGAVERVLEDLARPGPGYAAVVIDPTARDLPDPAQFTALRQLCWSTGTVLVFDEVVSGFRLGLRGFAGLSGVFPDLACYGKALGNGLPLSVLAGRRALMDGLPAAAVTTTFGGDCAALAAAQVVLAEVRAPNFYLHLETLGTELRAGLERLLSVHGLADRLVCAGYPAHTRIFSARHNAADENRARWIVAREMGRRGIFWQGSNVLCRDHTEADLKRVLAAYEEIVPVLARELAGFRAVSESGRQLRRK